MPKPNSIYAITLKFLMIASLFATGTARADDFDAGKLQAKIIAAVEKVSPAVVAINDRGSIFSGVIASHDGIVLTAGHAARPHRTYTIMLRDGRKFKAKGLGVDERIDMAMIKIEAPDNLPVAELGHSSTILRFQPVIGVSHPGIYNSRRGPVVRFGYIEKPVTTNEGMIESTAMMEPGDSGGPLIDLDGKVIGIHSNIRRSENLNYDVPIDSFRKYWDELQEPDRLDISGWPSLPKFGFRAADAEGRKGITVTKVVEGGLAEQSGIEPKDLITQFAGKKVGSRRQFSDRLVGFRSRGELKTDLLVMRDGKPIKLHVDFTDKSHPKPDSFEELKDFPLQFKTLESRLDDVEFVVRSKINGNSTKIRATRIFKGNEGVLVSKSTRVGEQPEVVLADGSRIKAIVVERDAVNDLVLLRAALPGRGGIDLRNVLGDLEEKPGRLLLTPDSKGPGTISVWGSKYFSSPRTRASGGYLGVLLGGPRSGGAPVTIAQVHSGAARKAGIKSGDVLLRMDDMLVKKQNDVFEFLTGKDPNSKIAVLIKRDEEELEKEIVLGDRPYDTGHVADDLVGGKSKRRDGFSLIISHDAVLGPDECGGPVFDIKGNFLGINIARNSRTRCYVIPKTVVARFVESIGY